MKPPPVGVFPFGRPVLPRPPSASAHRRLFVLGAYPSALHVVWHPPYRKPIKAIAVDNEPEPFWNGADESERIASWKSAVGFRDGEWGHVAPVGDLNGSSGAWVDEKVLAPLGAGRADAWITDCLDTYRASDGLAKRLADTYAPFADRCGCARAVLATHPSENAIVAEAVEHHRERLLAELLVAAPAIVVTLGNAALRVLRAIADANDAPPKLAPDAGYAAERFIEVHGRRVAWLPLAHPAAPAVYQTAHEAWSARRRGPGALAGR